MKRVLITLVTALLLSTPGPASAGDPASQRTDVGLSVDGVHYQGDLDGPLFDPLARWVPGEVRRSSFWVRNQASGPGDLTVDLLARSPRTLIDSGYLSIAARAGDGPWRAVETGGAMRLFTTRDLPSKAELPVTVRITLSPDAHNGTMVLATALDLRVTLTDARASGNAGGPGGSDGPEGPGGLLPGTGSPTSWWLLPLGLLLVAGGASQLARRRPLVITSLVTHPSGDHE
jgi:hypothetical protein